MIFAIWTDRFGGFLFSGVWAFWAASYAAFSQNARILHTSSLPAIYLADHAFSRSPIIHLRSGSACGIAAMNNSGGLKRGDEYEFLLLLLSAGLAVRRFELRA